MAFQSVISEDPQRIVFERDDGREFVALRSPEADELARRLPRREPATAPHQVPRQPGPPAETYIEPDMAAADLYNAPAMAEPPRITQTEGVVGEGAGGASNASEPPPMMTQYQPSMGGASGQQVTSADVSGSYTPPEGAQGQPGQHPSGSVTYETTTPPVQVQPPIAGTIPDTSAGGAAPGLVPGPVRVWKPGSPGVSQAQLQARAETGTDLRSKRSEVVENAIPIDPDLERGYAQLEEAKLQAATASSMAGLSEVERAKEMGAARRDELFKRQAFQRGAEQRARNIVAAQQAKIEELDIKLAASEIDPNRAFSNGFARIAAAIAMGLGAYGAILGKSENFAQQLIMKTIDADVEAQKAAYLQNKDARNNLVAELDRELKDLDAAVEGAKYIQEGIAQSYAQNVALMSKRKEVLEKFQNDVLGMQQRRLERIEKVREKAIGKVTSTTEFKTEYPKAGSPGGWVIAEPGTPAWGKYWETMGKGMEGMRKVAGVADPEKATEATADLAKQTSKLTGGKAQLDKTIALFEDMEKKYGKDFFGVPGYRTEGVQGLIVPWRPWHAFGQALDVNRSKDALDMWQAQKGALNMAVEANKGTQTEGDITRKAEEIEGSGSFREVLQGLKSLRDGVDVQLKALQGGYGVQTTKQQQQGVRDVSRLKGPSQGTPRPAGGYPQGGVK